MADPDYDVSAYQNSYMDSDNKIRVDNKLAASKHEKEDVSVIDICGYFYL